MLSKCFIFLFAEQLKVKIFHSYRTRFLRFLDVCRVSDEQSVFSRSLPTLIDSNELEVSAFARKVERRCPSDGLHSVKHSAVLSRVEMRERFNVWN